MVEESEKEPKQKRNSKRNTNQRFYRKILLDLFQNGGLIVHLLFFFPETSWIARVIWKMYSKNLLWKLIYLFGWLLLWFFVHVFFLLLFFSFTGAAVLWLLLFSAHCSSDICYMFLGYIYIHTHIAPIRHVNIGTSWTKEPWPVIEMDFSKCRQAKWMQHN